MRVDPEWTRPARMRRGCPGQGAHERLIADLEAAQARRRGSWTAFQAIRLAVPRRAARHSRLRGRTGAVPPAAWNRYPGRDSVSRHEAGSGRIAQR